METQVKAVETPDEAMTTLAEDEATGCLLLLLLVSSAPLSSASPEVVTIQNDKDGVEINSLATQTAS
ncbi:hypothetical protein PC128_g14526 [Phytophthora cactorum]|nr:hypothetical protein PC120_g11357 [Phytophthora cactorum]KAG3076556.1 hypothetical protein PC121_g7684 [Phytophthora cactorum]KAG3182783.1 hypothetical protein PC128_g14526 [Phytophthora cactorum]KAG4053727.1 hypothetical protein PC123_g11140 [Phytophthora cactorum]